MMRMKVFLCAIALCMASPRAFATLIWDNEEDFISGSIVLAKVTSTVDDLGGNQYLYTYTISNATEKFTSFIVAIDPSISASIVPISPSPSGIVSSWVLTDDGDAMVATITGNLKTSGATATVSFTCSQSPTGGDGALANVKYYAQGIVATPIPEPVTMALLGCGWVLLRRYKRKEA